MTATHLLRQLRAANARAKAGDYEGALQEYERVAHSGDSKIEQVALIQVRASLSAVSLLLAADRNDIE